MNIIGKDTIQRHVIVGDKERVVDVQRRSVEYFIKTAWLHYDPVSVEDYAVLAVECRASEWKIFRKEVLNGTSPSGEVVEI